jgi:hypothetical protein
MNVKLIGMITMTRKTRTELEYDSSGFSRLIDNSTGAILSSYRPTFRFTSFQRTDSVGHPWKWSAKKIRENITNSEDLGGPFETRRVWHQPGAVPVSLSRVTGGFTRAYDGPMFAYAEQRLGSVTDTLTPSSNSALDAFGATLISRCLPTNPLSGAGQFLVELRDLPTASKLADWKGIAEDLRRIKKNSPAFNPRRTFVDRAASDWLNFQFGWVPFVKDVKDFVSVARDSEKHIRQFQRDSGKGIRRTKGFPPVITTTTYDMGLGYGAPSLDSYLVEAPGKLTRTEQTTIHRWFSGSFTYYLPPEKEGYKSFDAYAHRLYGLRLDIDLIWKVAPWTWAVDWITNFGDNVRNVAAFSNDGLVMRYGYVMETTTTVVEYSLTGLKLYGLPPLNLTQAFISKTKVRRKATPYGFGLDPSTFSAKQWSIIAALGISKAPRSLNF